MNAHCVANRLQIEANLISIKECTQAKSHTVANCVENLLHGAANLISI
jgi:hypothetical protein